MYRRLHDENESLVSIQPDRDAAFIVRWKLEKKRAQQ